MDDARIIAWIDGTLPPEEARAVAAAVAADPALAETADRHRRIRARYRAAFGGLIDEAARMPTARRPAPVVSLAAARARRAAAEPVVVREPVRRPDRWRALAIAAALGVGILVGVQVRPMPGIDDRPGALLLSPTLTHALDRQPSGTPGAIRIAQSVRAADGAWCRSFAGTALSGIACRDGARWQLRYAAPAGSDVTPILAIVAPGAAVDAATERRLIAANWR